MQSIQPVEIVAPVLTGVDLAPPAFYAGSGSTTISYSLTGPATASVVVTDSGGATVRTLQPDTAQSAGSYEQTWDATADDTSPLAPGSYSVVVTATTAVGTMQSIQPVELFAPEVLTGVDASPGLFYGGAGASGRATLMYTLHTSATVTVTVRDRAGTPVNTIQPGAVQSAGSYAVTWDGTGDGGVNLAEGQYSMVVNAITAAGTSEGSDAVQYLLTPVASEASLAVDGAGGYVLHAVIDKWSELLEGQTSDNYYYDGQIQPWEFTGIEGATVTLYVGADAVDPTDTSYGGSVSDTTGARALVDLAFPAGLAWQDEGGAPRPLYYSVQLTYGGSTRWYPASGRYPLRPPTDADGHVQFTYMTDIQTPLSAVSTPDLQPSAMTDATGPYTAIPRLSRSLGWAAVLSGLEQETGANLVLYGGDAIDRGADDTGPDNGGTQFRTLFDNEQTYDADDEWSLSRLSNRAPMALAPGNHDDIGVNASAGNRWSRWVYSPSGVPYYSFDQGDVHFIILDGYDANDDPAQNYRGWIGFQDDVPGGSRTVSVGGVESTFTNSVQADWLISAIDTDKPWTVIVMHYPLFDAYRTSATAYNEANTTGTLTATNKYYYGERDRLLEFFAAHGVDVVLGGHNHNHRRHVEKVRSGDGSVTSTMTFLTQAVAGGPPTWRDTLNFLPYLDWLDYDGDGVPDASEPRATADNNEYWDASAFGQENSPVGDSGYDGVADMYHATGQEYDDGITFSYSVFQTGSDDQGDPTLTLNVKFVSWDAQANAWEPWVVYDTAQIGQVEPGMVADRLLVE
jgi:flagellar hook assembly protein FlgD